MVKVKNVKDKQDLMSFFYISSGFISVYRKNEDILLGHLHAPIFLALIICTMPTSPFILLGVWGQLFIRATLIHF